MLEAITFKNIELELKRKYNNKSKTFAILLVKPNNSVVSNEILNNISYFHHRSRDHLDIFLPGYGAYWGNTIPDAKNVCIVDNINWSFSSKCFNDFVDSLELNSEFKYRGGCELILLDFKYTNMNFKTVVRVKLDKAIEDRAIFSVEEFIENVISKFIGSTSTYSVSDTLTLEQLGKSISSELCSRFSIFRVFRRSRHFTIYNYEKNV